MAKKSSSSQSRDSEVEQEIEWLSNVLVAQSENGLFRISEVKITFEQIEDLIEKARNKLDPEKGKQDPVSVEHYIDECWNLINTALNDSGKSYWYRFLHVIDIAIILGLAFFAVILLLAFVGTKMWFDGIPYWALLVGSLGGCLRGIWWLFNHISRKDFRRSWWYWFLISPVVGSGLGVIMYFAVLAGVAATTGSTTITQIGLVLFLSAFAGFNWNWAMQYLEKLAGSEASGKRP